MAPPHFTYHSVCTDPLNDEEDNKLEMLNMIEYLYETENIHKAIFLLQTDSEVTAMQQCLEERDHVISYATFENGNLGMDRVLSEFDAGKSRVLMMRYDTWCQQLVYVKKQLLYDCNFICTIGLSDDIHDDLRDFFTTLENKNPYAPIHLLSTERATYPWNLLMKTEI